MGTATRRNSKAHMVRFTDKLLRVVLTGAFAMVKKRAQRRRGVHAVALTPERRIILIRLRYARGWRLPGGGVGRGESLQHAALRELREEVGMTAHGEVRDGLGDPDPVLIVDDVHYRAPAWSWEVEAVMEAPIDTLPDDIAGVASRWIGAVRARI